MQHGQRGRKIFVRAVVGVDLPGQRRDANADANLAIQAARNPITAGSLLATGTTLGATTLVNILLDDSKLDAVRRMGEHDLLVGAGSLVPPQAKIACAVCSMLL